MRRFLEVCCAYCIVDVMSDRFYGYIDSNYER